ncbi:hypothetical protein CAOG_009825 [Capsaspora owczarzaki ATCC 30864]|uniref:Uncharacterized protein n=1 Tax=Capsaspora owczarzaki (strain ATCC 30864) TaxID=595528 RepID=A0A0D2X3L4_CAPO3|nr:hypothetical protein CAOG_009825 [Capsaspora owczarzaki ATCC 30864]
MLMLLLWLLLLAQNHHRSGGLRPGHGCLCHWSNHTANATECRAEGALVNAPAAIERLLDGAKIRLGCVQLDARERFRASLGGAGSSSCCGSKPCLCDGAVGVGHATVSLLLGEGLLLLRGDCLGGGKVTVVTGRVFVDVLKVGRQSREERSAVHVNVSKNGNNVGALWLPQLNRVGRVVLDGNGHAAPCKEG